MKFWWLCLWTPRKAGVPPVSVPWRERRGQRWQGFPGTLVSKFEVYPGQSRGSQPVYTAFFQISFISRSSFGPLMNQLSPQPLPVSPHIPFPGATPQKVSDQLQIPSLLIKEQPLSATFLRHLKEDCGVDPFYPATPWTKNEPFFLLFLVTGTPHPTHPTTPGSLRCDSREEQGCNKVKRHGCLSSHSEGSCAFEPS